MIEGRLHKSACQERRDVDVVLRSSSKGKIRLWRMSSEWPKLNSNKKIAKIFNKNDHSKHAPLAWIALVFTERDAC